MPTSVGTVREATTDEVAHALAAADAAAPRWAATEVGERAACLERTADLMEAELPELMALAVREAGKTLPNAVGEVREAVDFCRYYAARIRAEFDNRTHKRPRPRRLHRPLELPARHLHRRGRGRAGRRQHGPRQARRADPADRRRRRPPVPPRRRARRRPPAPPRQRRHGRRGPGRRPARPGRRVHRLDRGGAADQPQARRARRRHRS